MLRRYILIYLFLFWLPTARAAIDSGSVLHFNLRSGFPSNNVYSVILDKNNYLWFATDHGLVKYNGYNIETFNTSNGNLPSDDVYELFEDKRGRLWLKTFSDKLGFVKNGVFKSIAYSSGARVIRPQYFSEVGGIVYFAEIWGNKTTLVFVDDDVIKVVPISYDMKINEDPSSLSYISISANFTINLWTRELGLYEWHIGSKDYLRYIGAYPKELRDSYAYGLFVSPDNKAYKANMDTDEVYYFDLDTKLFKVFGMKQHGAEPSEKLYTYNAEFYPGNYARNTAVFSNTHIYTLDTNFNFVNRREFRDILPTNKQIVYRLTDKLGQTWFTTKGDGAWFKPSFYNFYANRNVISEIQNTSYLGSVHNTSYWWDKAKLEMYECTANEKPRIIKFDKGVELKCISGNDSIAYISSSNGIYLYNKRRKSVINTMDNYSLVMRKANGVAYDEVNRKYAFDLMHETRSTTLVGDTLYCLVGNGYVNVLFRNDTGYVQHNELERYSGLFHDVPESRLYLYSNHKVLVKNLTDGTSKEWNDNFVKSSDVNNIRQLVKDKYGNIFLLGDKYLFLYNERTDKLERIKVDFSVANAVLALKGDKLYIAGKFGIAFASVIGTNRLGRFSILPNMVADRYNRVESFVIDDNGYGILNTDIDCYSFSIDSLAKYVLDGNGNGFFSLVLLSPSEKQITGNDTFKYAQSESQIRLDAINSFGRGNLKFSYRIDVADKWTESVSGEIFLGSLAPGEYHQVNCVISDEIWESKVYNFYLYRTPYWWQTANWKAFFWVTGIFMTILLVVIIVLLTRRYTAKKEQKRRALTELELRAIHSQINPHFIFNTLSTALFFINKKRFDDAYLHVSKFSRLLRAYLKSSQDRYVVLGEEITMLRHYIELQQVRFEEKFEFNIKIDNKLPINNIQIPSLLLQPLVENAINHGLFHREDRGELSVKFLQGIDNAELICIIEDNGVGREAATKLNAENAPRESYGTKLTTKLLEVFKQYEHMDITLEYIDKKEPETGTIVTLTLKNLKYIT